MQTCQLGCMAIQSITAVSPLQVNAGTVELALLDTSTGSETIPSLRIATALQSCITMDTHDTRWACHANGLFAYNAKSKIVVDIQGRLSSRYFNSSLNVEEALLSV